MIRKKLHGLPSPLPLMSIAVVAIGLATSAAVPALAQSSRIWNKTGGMNVARESYTTTLLQNGQVLVAGGFNNSGSLTSAELYNPSKGKWTLTGSMNTIHSTATLLQGGQVLAAGGGGTSTELYNPSTGAWTITGTMTTVRSGYTATLLPNGQVLVAGGCNSNGCLSSAELYNPSTGTWTATGSMNRIRTGHTAKLLANGRVLVAGGVSGTADIDTSELYNPSSGTWTLTGNLNIGHYDVFGIRSRFCSWSGSLSKRTFIGMRGVVQLVRTLP